MVKAAKKRSERNTDITRTDVVVMCICVLIFLGAGLALLFPYINDLWKFKALDENMSAIVAKLKASDSGWEFTKNCTRIEGRGFSEDTVQCSVTIENNDQEVSSEEVIRRKVDSLENILQASKAFRKVDNGKLPYPEPSKSLEAYYPDLKGYSSIGYIYLPMSEDQRCQSSYSSFDGLLKSHFSCTGQALAEHYPKIDQ